MCNYTGDEFEVRILNYTLGEERIFASRKYIDRLLSDPIYESHRIRFVNWLQMRPNARNYMLTYLAMTFYDIFLSETPVYHDFPILCLACYHKAALLYGRRPTTVAAIFDIHFTNSQIRDALKSLETILKHNMLQNQTPFAFLSCFCLNMYKRSYLPEATDYIMESMPVTSLLYYRPSLIAAAAVVAAHATIEHSKISREDINEKLHTVTKVGRIDVDAVFSCYLRMVNWRNQRDTGISPPLLSFFSCPSTCAVSFPPEMEMYQVLNEIGSCSGVFKVRDVNTFEMFAVKEITTDQPDVQLSAGREVIILNKLQQHPHVVKLREFFYAEKGVYLVMDLLDRNLGEHIFLHTISTNEIKSFVKQILLAVAYCHENGVIHGDLKLENLLLDSKRNQLKLTDFGSAAQFEIPGTAFTPYVGTHCAPEVLLGSASYTMAIDIWSAGCIFAQLVKGQDIFKDHNEGGKVDVQKLRTIFSIMGTPNEEVMPGITQFIESNKIPKFSPKDLKDEFPDLELSGLDLLSRMLCLDPRRRISANEALRHQYVRDFKIDQVKVTEK